MGIKLCKQGTTHDSHEGQKIKTTKIKVFTAHKTTRKIIDLTAMTSYIRNTIDRDYLQDKQHILPSTLNKLSPN